MFLLWTLFIILLIALAFQQYRILIKYKWVLQFNGPTPVLPVLGNIAPFIGPAPNVGDYYNSYFKTFGLNWRLWILSKPTIFTADPKLVETLLSGKHHLDKHFVYHTDVAFIFGDNGLVTSKAKQWINDRKIFNRLFNVHLFESSFAHCHELCSILISSIALNGTSVFDPSSIFLKHFMRVILKSFKTNEEMLSENYLEEMEKSMKSSLRLIQTRETQPWAKHWLYWKMLGYEAATEVINRTNRRLLYFGQEEKFFKQEVTDAKEQNGDTDTNVGSTLKEVFCNKTFSSQWKIDHFISIFGGATDTSSITLLMTLFFLALNRECNQKAQMEADAYFEKNDIAITTLGNLNYIKKCIKEALRMHPPIPIYGRTTSEDILLADGRVIPKGSSIMIVVRDLHMNPKFFPNPEVFDPERFSHSNVNNIQSYTYIPFSKGPRNCIGQKVLETVMPITIAHILKHYDISTLQKAENIKQLYEIAGPPSPAVKLAFKRRC